MLLSNIRSDFRSPIRSTTDAQAFAVVVASLTFLVGEAIDLIVNDAFSTTSLRIAASVGTVASIAILIAYPVALMLGTNFLALYRTRQKLIGLESSDPLTGLKTRRHLMKDLVDLAGTPGALLIFDVDRFRLINDQYGPEVGDKALIRIARLLAEELGDLGPLYRTGSDEFILLAPGHKIEAVRSRAALTAIRLENTEFGTPDAHIGLTLSGGLTSLPAEVDIRALLAKANEALAGAQATGRGRVVLIDDRVREAPGLVVADEIGWSADDLPPLPDFNRRRGHSSRLTN
jgi:diguanylate cyclase (GGDEF)-like protein